MTRRPPHPQPGCPAPAGRSRQGVPMPAASVLIMQARLLAALRAPGQAATAMMAAHARTSQVHAGKDRPSTATSLLTAGRSGKALCGAFARDLVTATTYQVTANMARVVHAACASDRSSVCGLHTEELPAETGFAWLDSPVRLAPHGAREPGEDSFGIDAITWGVCTYDLDGTVVPGVQVTGWSGPSRPAPRTPGAARRHQAGTALPLMPLLTEVTPLGHAPAGFQREGTLGIAHWVHVMWIFMSAEITSVRRDPVARAYRRRAAALRQSEVNVVALRRARAAGDDSPGGPRDIEWSCCWPVQGHHRHTRLVPGAAPHHATPAGADRGHCAICAAPISWVHGYIKGPEGMPLRVHDKTLYRLSR